MLSCWEKLNIIGSVDLLGDYPNLISNRKLERIWKYAHCHQSLPCSQLADVLTNTKQAELALFPVLD